MVLNPRLLSESQRAVLCVFKKSKSFSFIDVVTGVFKDGFDIEKDGKLIGEGG